MVIDNENRKLNFSLPGPNQDNDKIVSAEITQQLQRDFKDVLTGIGCFDEAFSWQVKPDSKPCQAFQLCVALCPAKTIQRGVKVTPTARHHNTTRHGWHSRMVQQLQVPKPNGKFRLFLDPVWLNQAIIRPSPQGMNT